MIRHAALGIGLLAAVALSTPARSAPRTYAFDLAHSEIGFDVRHFFNKTHGRFNEYDGTLQFDPDNLAASSVEVAIEDSSVYTGNAKRDGHLRTEDFFWVEKHPRITFKSTKVVPGSSKDRFKVEGNLTIRGVTKPVTLDVEFLGQGPIALKGPEGKPAMDLGTQVGFVAKTTVNRKDFGIVWNRTLDTGGFMLGDEVDITLNIAAVSRNDDLGSATK